MQPHAITQPVHQNIKPKMFPVKSLFGRVMLVKLIIIDAKKQAIMLLSILLLQQFLQSLKACGEFG